MGLGHLNNLAQPLKRDCSRQVWKDLAAIRWQGLTYGPNGPYNPGHDDWPPYRV